VSPLFCGPFDDLSNDGDTVMTPAPEKPGKSPAQTAEASKPKQELEHKEEKEHKEEPTPLAEFERLVPGMSGIVRVLFMARLTDANLLTNYRVVQNVRSGERC
jgi:hypothetical protein